MLKKYSPDDIFISETPVIAKKYSLDEILQDCPPYVPKPVKSYNSSPNRAAPSDPKTRLERATKYLAKVPPAIQGDNGSRTTFIAAKKLLTQCGLTPEETYNLLLHKYNPRCCPPWTEDEL